MIETIVTMESPSLDLVEHPGAFQERTQQSGTLRHTPSTPVVLEPEITAAKIQKSLAISSSDNISNPLRMGGVHTKEIHICVKS